MNKLGKRFEELWPMLPSSLPWELHEILVNLHTRIRHLESAPTPETQQSAERPATTESSTKAGPSAAAGPTTPTTPLLPRLLGALTEDERIRVERDSAFVGKSVVWVLSQWMLAQDVELRTSTSVRQGSEPSAGTSAEAAATSLSTSSDWRDFYSPEVGHYVCRDTGDDSPSTPCFYMASGESARNLKQLLNRAVLPDLPMEVS